MSRDWDAWSQDEWWRAQNPGLSAARGILWGTALSALMVAVVVVAVWAVIL